MDQIAPDGLRIGDVFRMNGDAAEYTLSCIYMDLGIATYSKFGKTEYVCLCLKPTDRELRTDDGACIPAGSFVFGELSSGKPNPEGGIGSMLSELEKIVDNQPVNQPYGHLTGMHQVTDLIR